MVQQGESVSGVITITATAIAAGVKPGAITLIDLRVN